MRRDSKTNTREAKLLARKNYAERRIDKWIKWSWDVRGKVKYKDLVKIQEEYEIYCYSK